MENLFSGGKILVEDGEEALWVRALAGYMLEL